MKQRFKTKLFIAGILFFCLGISAMAQDILQFRGSFQDSMYRGRIDPLSLQDGAEILWETNVKTGYSGVAISGNKLFTMGYAKGEEIIWCLDVNTGEEFWNYKYKSRSSEYSGTRATPTIDGESVYTLSGDGKLFSLNKNNGDINWSKDLQKEYGVKPPRWNIASSVVISDDILVVNVNKNGIALNKNNGDLIWKSNAGLCGYSTPVLFSIKGKKAIALFGNNAFYGVDLATGQVLWSYKWETAYEVNAADPLIFGDKIFITSAYDRGGALFRFTASSITKIWENKNLAAHFTSPVFYNGLIYGINGDSGTKQGFRALDPATGKIVAELESRFGNFILIGSYAVIITERGELSINSITHSEIVPISNTTLGLGTFWTMPIYSSGKLFIRNDSGTLFCIQIG